MLTRAADMGIKALAITDHGLTLGGRLHSTFFKRLMDPVSGIRLLKGVECNLLKTPGNIDCPTEFLPDMDVVLLGIHENIQKGLGRNRYTDLLLRAMEKNPYVDIIAHPNVLGYEVEFEPIAQAAIRYGMALELNNSKSALGRTSPKATQELILTCKRLDCPVVVSSDAHTVDEIGQDTAIRPLFKDLNFPEDLIVNKDESSAIAFIEKRRKRKQHFDQDMRSNLRKAAS
jgi:putative hydrolase